VTAAAEAEARIAATQLSAGTRNRNLAYVGLLMLLIGMGSPANGLIDLPISFLLKNKLHLASHEVANFRLLASVPLYLSFVFGFARDRWNLFGRKDRALLVLFGGLCGLSYGLFAFSPATYPVLLTGVLLSSVAWSFAHAAQQGLSTQIGQQHAMSGQVSTIWNIFIVVPYLISYLLGGALSQVLEGGNADQGARALFLIGAALLAAVGLLGVWRPKVVYDNLTPEPAPTRAWDDLKRLARHWPVYPALGMWFLFSFAPGSGTPLQYYLQNTLHATDSQWGQWNAIFAGAFIPTYLLFGALCRRYPLSKLLWWGTIVAVPQMVPLWFIHSVDQALLAAAAIGLLGGVVNAAMIDLLIRSAPPGLQGTTLMMSVSLYWIAVRFGDVLGTRLYDHFGGFGVCVIAITVAYALMIPVLMLVPKPLIATADGEVARPVS
jgi:MFS family permease